MLIHGFFASMVLLAVFVRRHQVFFVLTALCLFLFAALRYGFGNDYFSYYRCFLEIQKMGENPFGSEWIFTAFNRIAPHYYWLVAFSSLAFIASVWMLIRKGVPEQWIWVAVAIFLINPYLFLVNLSAMRQSLALVCFMCAVPFACKRKPLPYCLLILTACGFHNSAIVLFPAYFVANMRCVSRRATIIIALLTIGLLILGHYLYQTITASLALLQLTQYQYVLLNNLHNSLRATLLSSVTFVYLLWNMPRLRGNTLVYAKLWLVGSMFSVLAYRMSMLTRLQMYFDIFSIVAFPRMLARTYRDEKWKEVLNRYLFPALILLILVLRYYSFFHNPMWESFHTYQTILTAP